MLLINKKQLINMTVAIDNQQNYVITLTYNSALNTRFGFKKGFNFNAWVQDFQKQLNSSQDYFIVETTSKSFYFLNEYKVEESFDLKTVNDTITEQPKKNQTPISELQM